MTFQTRIRASTAGWVILVTAAIVVAMLATRGRLPDPIATHWGPSGQPDGRMSFLPALLIFLALWAAIAAGLLATLFRDSLLTHRGYRAGLGALLAGAGVFFLGLTGTTIAANLDRTDWADARPVGLGQVALVLVVAVAAGAGAGALARRGPHVEPIRTHARPEPLSLAVDEHTVWITRVTNRFLTGLAGVFLVAAAATAIASLVLPRWVLFAIALPLAVIAVAGTALSSVRVEVNWNGLTVGYGPWAWPARRIPLSEITEVWTERRTPAQVGGWGYRGLPGARTTVMIRAGDCLVIRRRSGAEFAVSADDARHGAALLDALRQQLRVDSRTSRTRRSPR